mgnify:CR=1 FL=1
MYQARRSSRSEFVPIRNLQYHVRLWGTPTPGQAPLVMVHGWMDVAASYQFVVDAFARDRYVIAPDWRGYGLTECPGTDNYWFPDYLADLDFLLDHYSPDAPVDLVGHSMGGNVVMFYAGTRPGRIRRLVNLEGFGMPATRPAQAPGRYARWMDELKALHRGDMALKPYADVAGVASRLMKTNPRLSQDKADWLAPHWARPNAQGQWEIMGDPAHKIVNAQLFRHLQQYFAAGYDNGAFASVFSLNLAQGLQDGVNVSHPVIQYCDSGHTYRISRQGARRQSRFKIVHTARRIKKNTKMLFEHAFCRRNSSRPIV